jgi:demethylmenaquinone methyltransferase/2-methoxy-6-polyprenyl-1,4-benzoquinol methylase
MFTRISGRYDLLNTLMTGGMHYRWKALAADVAARGQKGPGLDIATGTGDLAFSLARRAGIRGVAALDFSEGMLRVGRAKARKKSTGRNVDFILGDAMDLPFPDDSFASVTTGFSLRNVADVSRVLAEVLRVLVPGGRLVILEMTPLEKGGLFNRLFRLYFHGAVPWLGKLAAGEQEAYTYLPRSVDIFLDAKALAAAMRQAGFTDVRYKKVGMGTVALHTGVKPTPSPKGG